ncbi:hypothetical protein Tco_0556402, partial [Tanacetum coccineum]
SDTSIGAKDTGFGRGNQPKKLTQGYYAVTSIIKEDDFSESSLRRNIDDKVTPGFRIVGSIGQTSNANLDMGDDVDINTLTMEQYLALIQDNIRPGIVKPKIGDDIEFEINGNFIKELRPNFSKEDEGDINDGWDITIKDVERLRQILTPTIHTLPNLELVVQPYMLRGPVRDEVKVVREEELEYDIPLQNGVMQPLTPQTVHIIPPDDDYVAPTTNPILDKHLNEFDMTRVDENGNFMEDIKELLIKTHVECETFI